MDFGDDIIVPHIVIAFLDTLWQVSAQEVVNEDVDISDVDFGIVVDIGSMVGVIVGFAAQQDVNQGVDVGDVYLTVMVDIGIGIVG